MLRRSLGPVPSPPRAAAAEQKSVDWVVFYIYYSFLWTNDAGLVKKK